MARFPWFRRAVPARANAPEQRAAEFNVDGVPVSAPDFFQQMGWSIIAPTAAGITVTIDKALQVPAVAGSVAFLSDTMASLPIGLYKVNGDGLDRVQNSLSDILQFAPNDEISSFEWRKTLFGGTFTGGRGLSYIERSADGLVQNIWPIDPATATVKRQDGKKSYVVRSAGKVTTYQAAEIIDIPFMLQSDMTRHRGPITMGRDVIALAIAATQYGSRVFLNSGLPPLVLEGPFVSGAGVQRAASDMTAAIRRLGEEGSQVLPIPAGHKMSGLAFKPEEMQMLELQKWCVVQIARLYGLPPVFLQDMEGATFSNSEQQDLHLTKHTVSHWVQQFEQELTLKLFGRQPGYRIKLNMDALLRGDLASRMEAHARAIQAGVYSPATAARIEDKPVRPEADVILVQGAMMPITSAGNPKGAGNAQ